MIQCTGVLTLVTVGTALFGSAYVGTVVLTSPKKKVLQLGYTMEEVLIAFKKEGKKEKGVLSTFISCRITFFIYLSVAWLEPNVW